MKKIILSLCALVALSTASFAQNSPFEWQAGENTKIKVGGYIRANMNADFGGYAGAKLDFQPANISDADWSKDDYLNFDVTASRLSLEILQSTDAVGDIKVFVEADFRGAGSTARLRQAYIETQGVIAGFAWSFMSDLAANAPTIDITGVNSRSFLRTQMLGYRHAFDEKLSAGIAIEVPSLNADAILAAALNYKPVYQIVPNVPFYVQYKTDRGHIKASAALRALQIGDVAKKSRETMLGWGAQLSGAYRVTDCIKLYGQGIYGQGINNYINDLSGLAMNIYTPEDPASFEATPMFGASIGFSTKFTKKLSFAASGSYVENLGGKTLSANNYQSGSYVSATLFYALTPRVTLGAECVDGSRTNFGGDPVLADRATFMIKYTL